MAANGGTLLGLPTDILVTLPFYLHNIEDYVNLSSTCTYLRQCMQSATPNVILHLAAAQSRIFFRPDPYVLVAATARQLGQWARQSEVNEQELALRLPYGIDAMLELALEKGCGITMERIRELYEMRFSHINPVADIVDRCVGKQWFAIGGTNFWSGGVSDPATILAEAEATTFHLVIYGELFGPDMDTFLDQRTDARTLSVATRLEFVKYCIPDDATCQNFEASLEYDARLTGGLSPMRAVQRKGPYTPGPNGEKIFVKHNNNLALSHVMKSSRWKPHLKTMREKSGEPDFTEDGIKDLGWSRADDTRPLAWKQRMWENVMLCQGLDGLGMLLPKYQDSWVERVREWREKIERLERRPEVTTVGRQTTLEYPWLRGDLRICVSGFSAGT